MWMSLPFIDKQVRPILWGLFMVRGRKGVGKRAKGLKGHYVDLKKNFIIYNVDGVIIQTQKYYFFSLY